MDVDYQAIIEKARDGVVVVDEGVIKYVNPSVTNFLGYDKEDFLGAKFLSFIYKKDREKIQKNYEEKVRGSENFLYETKMKKKDGSLLTVEVRAQKIKNREKVVDLAIIRDVSSRKKAEEVFFRQEERFHAVTENTPDIIARFDRDYRYVYINAAGEDALGISRKDIFWKTERDIGVEEEKAGAFEDAISFVFKNRKRKTFYSEMTVKGEKRHHYTIMVPEFFADGDVNSVLSITRDITKIKEIDQIKSEFISITSHQLRSPLSVISWCSLALIRGDFGKISEEKKKYMEKIHESAQKLIKITDVFLDTTMIDLEMFIFNPKKVDIAEEAKAVTREFANLVEKKKIKFTEDYKNLSPVRFDPRVLKIIFRGIISNALEYTAKGGEVYFVLEKKGDGEIYLEVGDSGCGISKKNKEKIFTKFYRAKEARDIKTYGTGLNLYLIKSILDNIGGSIEVQSPNPRFGKGTVFYIKFPVSAKEKSL